CREGLDLVADHVAVDLTATDEVGPGYLQPVIPDRWDCDQMNGQADNHGHLRSRWRGVRPRGDPVWQQDHTHSLAVPEGDLQRAQQAVDVRVAVADIGGPDLGDEGGVDDAATFPRPAACQDHTEGQVVGGHGSDETPPGPKRRPGSAVVQVDYAGCPGGDGQREEQAPTAQHHPRDHQYRPGQMCPDPG